MPTATESSVQAWRVRKHFQWNGWQYAPSGSCKCAGECGATPMGQSCTLQVGTGCTCDQRACRCACRIPESKYAGDIWLEEPRNPRVETMLAHRYAVSDAAISATATLLKQPEYARLLSTPA